MYAQLFLSVLLFVSCDLTIGQSNKPDWTPEEFPNPITDPKDCRLSTEEPGYICDPNGIVGSEIESFQWILKDAASQGTKCPCSTYYCENHRGFKGYRIGVALVKKMRLQKGANNQLNTPEAQAQLFAYHLESRKWNMGRCEEDIIIFYSVEDRTLALYGGKTALVKLTPYYRNLLAHKVTSRFEQGKIAEALHNLIYDIKLILNCESQEHDCGIHIMAYSAGQRNLSIGIISLFAILAVLHSLWL